MAGSSRLAAAFGIRLALWGIPLILGAGSSAVAATAVLLAAVGVGNALVDVTVFTLLQRLVPDHVLGRVLGTAEMIWTVTVALASIATPFFIEVSNLRITLVVAGGALPLSALLCWRALARVDAVAQVHAADVAVLQAVPMLRPLPVPAIEHLAAVARDSRVPSGEFVFSEGDAGERFYIIVEGEAEVTVAGVVVRQLAAGDSFGEIALLRPVPRTASVRALSDLSSGPWTRTPSSGRSGATRPAPAWPMPSSPTGRPTRPLRRWGRGLRRDRDHGIGGAGTPANRARSIRTTNVSSGSISRSARIVTGTSTRVVPGGTSITRRKAA